jgi:hypothetical protein
MGEASCDFSPGSVFRNKLLRYELEPLFKNDEIGELLEKLDSLYYKNLDEDIVQLLTKYLL